MIRKATILTLIFLQTLLFSFDINKTILNGDSKFYMEMQKKLDKNISQDELNLQKSLLIKLAELSKPYKEQNLTIKYPTNEDEYLKGFQSYLNQTIKKSIALNDLKKAQNSLKIVANQIKSDSKFDLTKQLFMLFIRKR
jgi:hypothetical protein